MRDTHLAHMVHNQAARYGTKTALRYKSGDHWHDISYQSLGERIRTAAKALLELGVREGEMVGIYSGNRPEWTIADFAILSIRGVSVPIYATSTAGQAGYIVDDAEIRFMFVGNQTQYDRITSILEKSPTLAAIIVFDDGADLRGNPKGMHFGDFLERGRASARDAELDERLQRASTDDLATLIYTSGTTGEPKGVMLHHSNFYHSFIAHEERLDVSDRDVSLCFLPLSHVFERTWTYFAIGRRDDESSTATTRPKSSITSSRSRPTIMCAVPRFYEKIYTTVFEKLESAAPWRRSSSSGPSASAGRPSCCRKEKQSCSPRSLAPVAGGRGPRPEEAPGQSSAAGSVSSPAPGRPCSKKIEEFFHSAGIHIAYGYGLTETCATVTCHEKYHFRPGTVGKPIDGVEVRIGEAARSRSGGNGHEGLLQEAGGDGRGLHADGWFRTGDVGDHRGRLSDDHRPDQGPDEDLGRQVHRPPARRRRWSATTTSISSSSSPTCAPT